MINVALFADDQCIVIGVLYKMEPYFIEKNKLKMIKVQELSYKTQ